MRFVLTPTALFAGLLASLFATLTAGGCSRPGPPRAAVAGKVLVDNQPLVEGSISFFPTEGTAGPSAGGIIHDGQYQIPRAQGVIVGRNLVEIRGFRQTGKTVRDIWKPGESINERVSALGPEYNDRSTLVRDIQAADNQLDFDLPGTKDQ
jgi:hypothetical protein